MDTKEIVHVAVIPPEIIEADLIEKVAALINKDVYTTRLLLSGKIPRIVARCSTLQTAELTVQGLRSLGLAAISYTDAELRQPSNSFRAHSLQFSGEKVICRDKNGQSTEIEATDAFLVIKGIVETQKSIEVIKTMKEFNVTATLLTGIPIRRKVTEKTTKTSSQTEYFVRVYDRGSTDHNVEIMQYDFDYSCLGEEMVFSSLVNFNNIVIKMKKFSPKVIFDDRLTGHIRLDIPANTVRDKIEINCRLIYGFYRLKQSQ